MFGQEHRVETPFSQYSLSDANIAELLGARCIYQHQHDALINLRVAWTSRRDGVVVCPTGAGKTGIAVLAAYMLPARNVLVITPSRDLADQNHREFTRRANVDANDEGAYVIRRGIFVRENQDYVLPAAAGTRFLKSRQLVERMNAHNGHLPRSQCLLVANFQQLGTVSAVDISCLPRDMFDLVVLDEAHHYPAGTWKTILDTFSTAKVLYLTATPNLQWPPSLHQDLCLNLSLNDAISAGYIRDTNLCPGVAGDEAAFVDAIVDKLTNERPQTHLAMVISDGIDSARALTARFPPGFARSFVADDPVQNKEDFVKPDTSVRVLVICQRLLEGFDCKPVSVIGIARNIQSHILFNQFVGRGVRRIDRNDETVCDIITTAQLHPQQAEMYAHYRSPVHATADPPEELEFEEE